MADENIMKENKVSTEKLLVLLAGQSNMAGPGYAEPKDLTLIPDLLMIRPDRQKLVITGKGQQLQEMNDLFMTALDKVYVYYGIFGDQMVTKMWDNVSTSEQRKLQKKCNAVKNLLSVEAVTPGFIEYIRENKTDTAAGF